MILYTPEVNDHFLFLSLTESYIFGLSLIPGSFLANQFRLNHIVAFSQAGNILAFATVLIFNNLAASTLALIISGLTTGFVFYPAFKKHILILSERPGGWLIYFIFTQGFILTQNLAKHLFMPIILRLGNLTTYDFMMPRAITLGILGLALGAFIFQIKRGKTFIPEDAPALVSDFKLVTWLKSPLLWALASLYVLIPLSNNNLIMPMSSAQSLLGQAGLSGADYKLVSILSPILAFVFMA